MSFVCDVARLLFSSSEAAQMLIKTTTLNNAQIKALAHPTPVTTVSAPGLGLMIEPFRAVLFAKTTGGAYTNINPAAYLTIGFGSSDIQTLANVTDDAAITNGSATRLTDLLGGATNSRVMLLPFADTEDVDDSGPLSVVRATTVGTNADLQIYINNQGSSDLTGGHSANTLTVVVYYAIVAIP